MACTLDLLLLSILLKVMTSSLFSSALDVSAGAEPASCPPRWHTFGQRCFAFYPVWSSWSTAEFLCSQRGGHLASLHTPEEKQFVHQLANTHIPVWVGGYQASQSDYWFWSDGSSYEYSSSANQSPGKTREGGACMVMTGGELNSAPCGELSFYVCSVTASSGSKDLPRNDTVMVPGVSFCDVLLGYSESVAEEILQSSFLLTMLESSRLAERCYDNFAQQEALYLHRVSSTLQALMSSVEKESDDITSLLLDTYKHYSSYSTNHSLLDVSPPLWLLYSLQSFHEVVLEDPVYWLVALSARAHLRSFLVGALRRAASPEQSSSAGMSSNSIPRFSFTPRPQTHTHTLRKRRASGPADEAGSFYQRWRSDGLKEAVWEHRFREVIEKYQHRMDVFKAVNIFRVHMMNQKSLFKATSCDVYDGADEEEIGA